MLDVSTDIRVLHARRGFSSAESAARQVFSMRLTNQATIVHRRLRPRRLASSARWTRLVSVPAVVCTLRSTQRKRRSRDVSVRATTQ